jgi:hypothetical protein
MTALFGADSYPGKPKILFIGWAHSTHTHAWIDLLDGAEFNVRLFALPTSPAPPDDWPVRTYITRKVYRRLDPNTRAKLHPWWLPSTWSAWSERLGRKLQRHLNMPLTPEAWLARIIRQWQPDIIHTLALDPSGFLYFKVRNQFELVGIGKWLLQLRGSADLAPYRFDPEAAPKAAEVLRACDQLISDNEPSLHFVREMGVRSDQISPLVPVPGSGGIDVTALSQSWHGPPSKRRIILWPKAYDCPWSLALPVFESIKLCWDRIQPCEVYMLAMPPGTGTRMWFWALPEHIRQHCHVEGRIPRDKVLALMVQARVMLAPSLVDGTPNSMLEAMAAGAFPIVSPLETITPLMEHERHTLFARNLYPEEIAEALVRAMNDDALVDSAAQQNREIVRRVADRSEIRPRVVEYYKRLAYE